VHSLYVLTRCELHNAWKLRVLWFIKQSRRRPGMAPPIYVEEPFNQGSGGGFLAILNWHRGKWTLGVGVEVVVVGGAHES
jgi:hypothetical protein